MDEPAIRQWAYNEALRWKCQQTEPDALRQVLILADIVAAWAMSGRLPDPQNE
jgi:hypothetical protein